MVYTNSENRRRGWILATHQARRPARLVPVGSGCRRIVPIPCGGSSRRQLPSTACTRNTWTPGGQSCFSRRPVPAAHGRASPTWMPLPGRASTQAVKRVTRGAQVSADVPGSAGVRRPEADPLQVKAAQVFAYDLAADRVPSVRAIRAAPCRAAARPAVTRVSGRTHQRVARGWIFTSDASEESDTRVPGRAHG
jgi:hypothetical protein